MKDKEIITAWITKYAMTKGIIEMRGYVEDSMFVAEKDGERWPVFFHKNDFWLTKEDAIAHAKVMQQRKLGSLRRQIDWVESLNFEE